jgi:hypothetical protein
MCTFSSHRHIPDNESLTLFIFLIKIMRIAAPGFQKNIKNSEIEQVKQTNTDK